VTLGRPSLPCCALHVSEGCLLGPGGSGRAAFARVSPQVVMPSLFLWVPAASLFLSLLGLNCIGNLLRGVCCAGRAQLAPGSTTAWHKAAHQFQLLAAGLSCPQTNH
jgi:hypothetical protein